MVTVICDASCFQTIGKATRCVRTIQSLNFIEGCECRIDIHGEGAETRVNINLVGKKIYSNLVVYGKVFEPTDKEIQEARKEIWHHLDTKITQ